MYNSFETIGADQNSSFLILCDHASNKIPSSINNGNLGISKDDLNRHIAYDVGAANLSKELGKLLKSTVILSNFSRLVIDPNRGEDDPTLIMQLYDGTIISGNREISDDEKKNRLKTCYWPYHHEVDRLAESKCEPILISIHSFTPKLKNGNIRPWHIGILYSSDQRFSEPLLNYFNNMPEIVCGDNEPYTGALTGDTMDRHALSKKRLHVLIEVRNDLISNSAGQLAWATKLERAIRNAKEEIDRQGKY